MQFLLLLLLKVTLIALIGRLAIAAMPRASASTRFLIAVTTLCSMLLIPVIGASGFEWRLPVLPAQPQKTAVVEIAEPQPAAVVVPPALFSVPRSTDTRVPATLSNEMWALLAILIIGALLIGRMLFGIAAVVWITQRANEVTDDSLIREFDHAAEQLGITRFARLLTSNRVSVPLMWGITRPALLLPADALNWSRDRLRVVFLHELAHLRRCDSVTLLITRATTAMYWFHPLAWSLERIARRECEQACDDLVLTTGTRASEYADHLLSIAKDLPRHDPFASVTLAMSRRSQLEGRLLSILQIDARRGVVSRPMSIAATALAALLVLPIATVRLTAQTATPQPETGVFAGIKQELRKEVANTVTQTVSALATSLNEKKEVRKVERSGNDSSTSEAKDEAFSYQDQDGSVTAFRRSNEPEKFHLAKDKYRKYDDQYESLRANGSRDAEVWAKVGAKLLSHRDLPRAIDALSEAIRLDPFLGNAWYNLGCAYALSGDSRRALDTIEQSLLHGFSGDGDKLLSDEDLDSIHSPALDELAKLADDLALRNDGDRWSEAIARYESYANAYPNIARTWFNLGFAQCEGNQERAAVQSFQKVLSMGYRPGTTMYNIGCSYARLGERKTAVSWLMKSAAAGFDVGSYAKHDRDLDNVREDPWVEAQVRAARGKEE
jgi:beta-lactamase regulating signal transducer with metallopeptidase domain/Flp pilus assembly protein TadD